jgi:predicted transcriptional regulator
LVLTKKHTEAMSFEKFLQESCGATYLLRDMLNSLTDEQIEEAVSEFRDRDFVKHCQGACDRETMHRVIHACNECEEHI